MGGILIGALMIGASFGWRAEIIPDTTTPGGTLLMSYLLGGLGLGILVAGILQYVHVMLRGPDAVKPLFRLR